MNSEIIIQKAVPADTDSIFALMEYARIENEKKGFFCADTADYIKEHIIDPTKGFLLKAVCEDTLAGFFILHIPHKDANNMAVYKGLPESEYEFVVHFDSAVVHPDYRGRHIMDAFLVKTEELLSGMPYKHYFVTVHPDNHNSLKNILNHRFEIVTTTEKYGGLPRHILYKRSDATCFIKTDGI